MRSEYDNEKYLEALTDIWLAKNLSMFHLI